MKNDNINILLGAKIKSLRQTRGLTQADLAEKINTSLKHFGELERGKGNPSLKTLKSIAQILDVEICELFYFGHLDACDQITKSEQTLLDELIARAKTSRPEVIRLLHLILTT